MRYYLYCSCSTTPQRWTRQYKRTYSWTDRPLPSSRPSPRAAWISGPRSSRASCSTSTPRYDLSWRYSWGRPSSNRSSRSSRRTRLWPSRSNRTCFENGGMRNWPRSSGWLSAREGGGTKL